jgi:hypothetical protein
LILTIRIADDRISLVWDFVEESVFNKQAAANAAVRVLSLIPMDRPKKHLAIIICFEGQILEQWYQTHDV